MGLLRTEGFTADVAERRLPRCLITVDLFGAFDVVVRSDVPCVLGVLTTTTSNHAARATKLRSNPALVVRLVAGIIGRATNRGEACRA